ncbi:MAG: SDR family oxidoreductase [Planctomycetota bacterium]
MSNPSPRRAVVTGGTTGIGAATAELLLSRGWRVLIAARTPANIEVRVSHWREQGHDALGVACDLATDTGLQQLIDAASKDLGGPDVLVNNVGTNIRKPSLEYSESEIDQILRTNLGGPFTLCRALQPAMLEHGHEPSIVNVSSVAAQRCIASGVAYAASKAGLDQITRYLAAEWAPTPDRKGVRLNSVLPWYIDTPLVAPVLTDQVKMPRILERTPMGRVGKPEEVAAAIAFFASTDASFITGQTLAVDGGFMAAGLPTT